MFRISYGDDARDEAYKGLKAVEGFRIRLDGVVVQLERVSGRRATLRNWDSKKREAVGRSFDVDLDKVNHIEVAW